MKDDQISTGDKYLLSLLLLIILFFVLLRFINLDADFPQGITTSAALYTDEGWYSNAAIIISFQEIGTFLVIPT